MQIRYGISLASLLPWSLVSAKTVVRWAKEAGYDFIQVLPLRRFTGKEKLVLPIDYFEMAWNPVYGPLQVLPGLRNQPFFYGDAGKPANWRDFVAFPNPQICRHVSLELMSRIPQPRLIVHSFEDAEYSRLIELCPELDMTPEDIAYKCRTEGFGLVLDTEHLLRDFQANDPRYGRESLLTAGFVSGLIIEILAPYVRVVHVKGKTGDLMIVGTLLHSRHLNEIDFIAEYSPLISTPKTVKEQMISFLYGMKQLCKS